MKLNIFKEEEWNHIKKHNKAKSVLQLITSLRNNSCDKCRCFALYLFAIRIGFIVQPSGRNYVLKKDINKAVDRIYEDASSELNEIGEDNND